MFNPFQVIAMEVIQVHAQEKIKQHQLCQTQRLAKKIITTKLIWFKVNLGVRMKIQAQELLLKDQRRDLWKWQKETLRKRIKGSDNANRKAKREAERREFWSLISDHNQL